MLERPRGARRAGSGGLLLVLLLASACGGDAEPDESAGQEQAVAAEAGPLVAVSLGERDAGLGEEVERTFAAEGLRVRVMAALGTVMAQENHVQQLIELGPQCLVIQPVSPLVLQKTHRLCADRGIALLAFGHGEPSGLPWVGIGQRTGARELGRRAAEALQSLNVDLPRILVVEDRTWPETKSWANEVLRGVEEYYPAIRVLARVQIVPDAQEATERVAVAVPRLGNVDLVIGGDEHCTRAVVEGYRTGIGPGDGVLVGRSSDPQMRARVEVPLPTLLLLAWTRRDLLEALARTAGRLAAGEEVENVEVAFEILDPREPGEEEGSESSGGTRGGGQDRDGG